MIGRHTYPLVNPGDYGKLKDRPKPEGLILDDEIWERQFYWQLKCPDGSMCSLHPQVHRVTENEDGTITVFPSIVTPTWHGWLENGIWRSV